MEEKIKVEDIVQRCLTIFEDIELNYAQRHLGIGIVQQIFDFERFALIMH